MTAKRAVQRCMGESRHAEAWRTDEALLWKDYFDWWSFLVATVRGLQGAVVPVLRPAPNPPSA